MAPPDRKPDPWHPAASGIDGEFGHVGEVAAWVEWLLHPESHDHDRMIILPDGTRVEHTSNVAVSQQGDRNVSLLPDLPQPTEYHPFESVIQGCSVEQFFDPALALSGQLFDDDSDLSKVYQGLNDAFWKNNDWNGKLRGGFEDLRAHWAGQAATGAGEFIGAIDDFMADFTEIAKEFSAIPIAYGAIIATARKNLNDVMGKLVDAFHHKFYARGTPGEKVLVKALSAISGAALTYVTGGSAAAAFGAGLATAIDKALDSDGGDVGGGKWREIVDSYFVAQMKILQDARSEIEKLEANVARLAGRLADMPKLPG
jgi:hypothetical protein